MLCCFCTTEANILWFTQGIFIDQQIAAVQWFTQGIFIDQQRAAVQWFTKGIFIDQQRAAVQWFTQGIFIDQQRATVQFLWPMIERLTAPVCQNAPWDKKFYPYCVTAKEQKPAEQYPSMSTEAGSLPLNRQQ